jgi:hypothetical protein
MEHLSFSFTISRLGVCAGNSVSPTRQQRLWGSLSVSIDQRFKHATDQHQDSICTELRGAHEIQFSLFGRLQVGTAPRR